MEGNKHMKKRDCHRAGFTLIEMILVVAIISILAAFISPQLYNLKARAEGNVETSLIGSLQTAVEFVHLKNITNNSSSWPEGNPYELLENPIKHVEWFSGGQTPDGESWRYWKNSSETEIYIYSPYYNGTNTGAPGPNTTRGLCYVYAYGDNSSRGLAPGEWQVVSDWGY